MTLKTELIFPLLFDKGVVSSTLITFFLVDIGQ